MMKICIPLVCLTTKIMNTPNFAPQIPPSAPNPQKEKMPEKTPPELHGKNFLQKTKNKSANNNCCINEELLTTVCSLLNQTREGVSSLENFMSQQQSDFDSALELTQLQKMN